MPTATQPTGDITDLSRVPTASGDRLEGHSSHDAGSAAVVLEHLTAYPSILKTNGSNRNRVVDLTLQHMNHTVLAEGHEIIICPVSARRVVAGGVR